MKCSSMKTNKVTFPRPAPSGYIIICDLATFIRRQVSHVKGEGDHYKKGKLQLSFSVIISTFHAFFVCCLVCLLLV